MTYHIAVIGPKNITSVFRASGADVFPCVTGEEALERLRTIKGETESNTNPYAVVLVLEDIATQIHEEDFNKVTLGTLPSVLVVPGITASDGMSLARIRELAKRAIGIDILS